MSAQPEGGELPRLYTVADLCDWLSADGEEPVRPRYITDRVVKDGWPHIFIARQYRFTTEQMVAIAQLHVRGKDPDRPAFSGQVTRGSRRSP